MTPPKEQQEDHKLTKTFLDTGDETAFRRLYQRHTPTIYGLLLRLAGGNTSIAEELTHETWIRATPSMSGFGWKSTLRTWLCGIAVNSYREWCRKNPPLLAFPPHMEAPNESLTQKIDLERAINRLPVPSREVIVLHDIQGYTHREIGKLLGLEEGSCKSRLSRARKQLKNLIKTGEYSQRKRGRNESTS